jgi:hypothetical protein
LLSSSRSTACSKHDGEGSSEARSTESSLLSLDLAAPRLCTVTAYASATEPTKFAVGDFAVSSSSVATPSALPLSSIVRTDDAGQPTEARFAVSFRRPSTGHTSLFTPYSPLPLASRDVTSMTFATPADTPGDDRSMMKLTAPNAATAVLELDETVHGHPGRTIAIECTIPDAG